jgi:hypothetical protein
MATLLNISADELDELSLKHTRIYPIASRCGVFAKTDIQPLLNQGAAKENIAASIFAAVANQTIAGLAQGRRIDGKVMFLGGPLYYCKGLRYAFKEALKLDDESAVFPEYGRLSVALGAAIYASKQKDSFTYDSLEAGIEASTKEKVETAHGDPLFKSEQEYIEFCARHAKAKVDCVFPADYNGSDTYDFSELKSIVYGYPEYYTPNASSSYKKILEGILKEVFDGYGTGLSVTGVAEPELAAYAYHYAHRGDSSYMDRLQDRDKVLILDFGGHTLDIMVMQVQKGPRGTALKQYTRPGSDCYFVLLGKEITRKICNEIYDSDMIDPTVENAKCRLLAKPDQIGGDDQTPSKPHRMRTVCQGHDAFRLCYHSDAVRADQKEDHVALVGVYDRNGVDLRSEYRKAYNQIKDYLDMCYVETENIQHVLFAGGGACIADLRSYILDMLLNGRPASQLHVCGYFDRTGEEKDLVDYQDGSAIALSFKNAVAWGAALVSSGKQTLSERAFRDIRVNVAEFSAQLTLRDLDLVLNEILTEEQKNLVAAVYERHHLI